MKRKNETTFCVTKLQVCCEFSLPVAAVADTLSFRGLDRCFHRGRLLRWSLQTWREPVSVGLRCGARRPLCLLDSSREGPRGWHDNLLLRVYQPGTLTHWLNGFRGRVCEQSGQVHTQLAHFHCRLWRNIRRRGTVKGHGGGKRVRGGATGSSVRSVGSQSRMSEQDETLIKISAAELPAAPPSWDC